MKRSEYEDLEGYAMAVLIGLLSQGGTDHSVAPAKAFDIAEAFQQEKLKRIGEKPPFDS
ncbi:hypothetical protein [Pseudomonas juntendi]|jgi:hypothetical protein|uniref:hypothetical protein n=1 Tax=Pseudomonas juntendi TaxID=2666183 RepID=UPI002449F641|nr:hypothetical protein [Pseudomonas juntendi]MDG9891234.1 hypothetical protein [Pseudomonas juntendi]